MRMLGYDETRLAGMGVNMVTLVMMMMMMIMMLQAGCIPSSNTQSIGGSWSALTNAGEATNLNLAHVMEVAAS